MGPEVDLTGFRVCEVLLETACGRFLKPKPMLSRSVTLALVIGLGLGLGFNPKIRLRRPCRGLSHCSPTFAPSSQRTALSVRGLCYTVRRPLLLRRKGRLSVLMIRFRWVRSKPFAPSSQSMAQPSLCGHQQQQQACNTIRGVLVPAPRAFGP